MTRQPIVGKDCRLYYATGWATPTWVHIAQAMDVSQPGITKGKAPVGSRDSGGWNPKLPTLKEMNLEFSYLYETDRGDDTEDTVFTALKDSFLNDTVLIFAVMDGDLTVSGELVQGFRFPGIVFDFPHKEELEAGKSYDIGVELTRYKEAGTLRLPEWYEVTAS